MRNKTNKQESLSRRERRLNRLDDDARTRKTIKADGSIRWEYEWDRRTAVCNVPFNGIEIN